MDIRNRPLIKKILIVHASAGHGHENAAKAVEQAIRAIADGSVEIRCVDSLDFTPSFFCFRKKARGRGLANLSGGNISCRAEFTLDIFRRKCQGFNSQTLQYVIRWAMIYVASLRKSSAH